MSVASSGHDAVVFDDCHLTTPSPPIQQDDSHDEYTPTCQSAQSGTIWIMPSHHLSTTSIATILWTALNDLYNRIFGQDSIQCLLMLGKGGLNVAHTVRCASKSSEVSHVHNLWIIYLIIP